LKLLVLKTLVAIPNIHFSPQKLLSPCFI